MQVKPAKAKTLKELRDSKNMSIVRLAEKLGVDPSTVSNYERGARTPDLSKIVKIAEIFDISVAEAVKIFLPETLTDSK